MSADEALQEARDRIVDRTRDAIVSPPYGPNLTSNAFVLGLLTAANMLTGDEP